MIPIVDADEDLFGTLVAAARLGRIDALIEHLRTRYDQEWDDPLGGFPYALAMLAVLQSGREELMEQFNYTEIIETLSDLLYHKPDHWLGRYLRIHARTLLPAKGEYPNYLAAERARAVEDSRELIERQGRAAWQPWFACSYLVAARVAWQSDRNDKGAVASLVTEATARRSAPVRFPSLGSVMCSAFLWYLSQPELPERATVDAMTDALFPGHPMVARERPGRVARAAGTP